MCWILIALLVFAVPDLDTCISSNVYANNVNMQNRIFASAIAEQMFLQLSVELGLHFRGKKHDLSSFKR